MQPSLRHVDDKTGHFLPVIYPEELPYWEALKQRSFVLQQCKSCGKSWFPIGHVCPHCMSLDFEWTPMSGQGVLHNYVIYHKAWAPWLEKRVPYAVIQVEIDEGPRLTTNLLDCAIADIKIGMRVEACFEDITDEITLLQFRPAQMKSAR